MFLTRLKYLLIEVKGQVGSDLEHRSGFPCCPVGQLLVVQIVSRLCQLVQHVTFVALTDNIV